MATKQTDLYVFSHLPEGWAPCGLVTMTEQDARLLASKFAYGTRYLERLNRVEVDPVSLGLSDIDAVRGRELLPVNNLVEFGGIRDAAPDAWGRRIIEAKRKVPANSLPESDYLLEAGSERVGLLDVRRNLTDAPTPGHQHWSQLDYLMEAAERIEMGESIPSRLEAIFTEGTALGGARPKATVRDEQGVLYLAKFKSKSDRYSVPAIEAATLRLAADCGLMVPDVRRVQVGQRDTLLIRRFDRYWSPAGAVDRPDDWCRGPVAQNTVEHRMAFVSALTILGCVEGDSPTKAYTDVVHAIRRYVHPSRIRDDCEELFGRMVYNILCTNTDDHLRNHGFVRDVRLGGWRLSPLYDVSPFPSVSHDRRLHLDVGLHGKAATLDNAMTVHATFGLSERRALDIIGAIWNRVREWKVYFESYEVSAADIDAAKTAFRHIRDVASPDLINRLSAVPDAPGETISP